MLREADRCVASYKSAGWNTVGATDPIPALKVQNADVVLIIKSDNMVKYGTPIDDPFFAAHKVWGVDRDTVGNEQTLYNADSLVSAIGCVLEVGLQWKKMSPSADFSGSTNSATLGRMHPTSVPI